MQSGCKLKDSPPAPKRHTWEDRPVRISGKLIGLSMAVLLSAGTRQAIAQERPLPDAEPFLKKARAHLQTDRQLLSQYTYLERETKIHLGRFGTLTTGPVQVLEVYPGLEPDDTYRRLIEVNGRPRDPAELEKDDRRRQKHVLDEFDRRRHEDPAARERRLQREAKAHHQDEETLDDLLRVYQFTLVERQTLAGHPVIVVDFAPRPNAAPKTDDGRDMTKVKGRAWIAEDDYQIVRVSVEVLKDFSVGWFVGRLYAGTTASYERRKVNNEIWLPSRLKINASGRALIRKFHIDTITEYSDYRKFSVQTDTEFRKGQE
jgi:hypothetical protein